MEIFCPTLRLTIYRDILERFQNGEAKLGICHELWILLDNFVMDLDFPELFTHDPLDETKMYWWPLNKEGKNKRIDCLKACIAEVEKLIEDEKH